MDNTTLKYIADRILRGPAEMVWSQQLREAARKLCTQKATTLAEAVEASEPPDGWHPEAWAQMMNMSYKDRLFLAAEFLNAELKRIN